MATETVNLWEMYERLKHNFLFNNDIDSIHILLTLYDLEENISNICPKYMCIKVIKRRIKSKLRKRKDKELIANSIGTLILEEVDRLELSFYIDGYKQGYYNSKWVNILEERALYYYSIDEIYDKKSLFHYYSDYDDIKSIKEKVEEAISQVEKEEKSIEKRVCDYCDKTIKDKILSLNRYVDKQLTIDYNFYPLHIREEGCILTLKELNELYDIIVKTLTKGIIKIYKDAYWFGLNDKVLKRYI
ncbi:MAG TPA: hypothetical protein VK071_04840 [Tissierellales bacterium]|nr:hypothetical protein [Tissierellales bacterium]